MVGLKLSELEKKLTKDFMTIRLASHSLKKGALRLIPDKNCIF